jgi:hypothetical protein
MNGLRESACIGSWGETQIDYEIVNEEEWEREKNSR